MMSSGKNGELGGLAALATQTETVKVQRSRKFTFLSKFYCCNRSYSQFNFPVSTAYHLVFTSTMKSCVVFGCHHKAGKTGSEGISFYRLLLKNKEWLKKKG